MSGIRWFFIWFTSNNISKTELYGSIHVFPTVQQISGCYQDAVTTAGFACLGLTQRDAPWDTLYFFVETLSTILWLVNPEFTVQNRSHIQTSPKIIKQFLVGNPYKLNTFICHCYWVGCWSNIHTNQIKQTLSTAWELTVRPTDIRGKVFSLILQQFATFLLYFLDGVKVLRFHRPWKPTGLTNWKVRTGATGSSCILDHFPPLSAQGEVYEYLELVDCSCSGDPALLSRKSIMDSWQLLMSPWNNMTKKPLEKKTSSFHWSSASWVTRNFQFLKAANHRGWLSVKMCRTIKCTVYKNDISYQGYPMCIYWSTIFIYDIFFNIVEVISGLEKQL